MAGFEPTGAGVKVPCLTAWRHPNMMYRSILPQNISFVKSCFEKSLYFKNEKSVNSCAVRLVTIDNLREIRYNN